MLPWLCRLPGSGAKPGGFSGTLYDGGHVLQQLRDKVFAVCIDQAGVQHCFSSGSAERTQKHHATPCISLMPAAVSAWPCVAVSFAECRGRSLLEPLPVSACESPR